MNDRSAKSRQPTAATEKGPPRSGEYPRTSNVDDEFHEFFNQGDIGEYEGGVAYSQPPSRQLPEIEDERIVITDPALQRARRVFFGRVVAIIVTACVVLLVTAAKFRPQDTNKGNDNDTRHTALQYAETEEMKLSPPPKEQSPAVPVIPAVTAVPQAAVAVALPAPEANQPQAPNLAEKPTVTKSVTASAKTSDSPTVETVRPQAKQLPSKTISAARISSVTSVPPRLAQKSKTVATREAPPSTSGISKPVKDSVGAFPVD